MSAPANRLANETSPYLRQHAHNPVDWYPWGDEALEKARRENKPILVSIGYAACHWCHVMERESFEDRETAALMNEHFVNIKIDREERPDLDHIYMDAVQAITGSGGWPLNVFLTPAAKPFFGGTYFPPTRISNRSSWREVLIAVASAFKDKHGEIVSQADRLTEHLTRSNNFGLEQPNTFSKIFSEKNLHETFHNLMKSGDREWGGFGRAPKFPQTFSIQFLLRYHAVTGSTDALKLASVSLDKIIEGGIYDQLGGGFARYSTDREWLVPHFEKMLYDNALLVSVLAEAYQLTKKLRYVEVIDETMLFVQRELMNAEAGFYSALDADSDGEEGKYYVWHYDEIKDLLGDDLGVFCEYFNVSAKGNWSEGGLSRAGKNILHVTKSLDEFATENNLPHEQLSATIARCKSVLFAKRSERVRPGLDDKIILGWNALMNSACSQAYEATGKNEYRSLAIENMNFLFKRFKSQSDGYFHHTWKDGQGKNFAFLDDYAFLVRALVHLHQITANYDWLLEARQLAEYVNSNFTENETGFFFFTSGQQTDVIVRKKEVYDGATPSGNAAMAYNMYHLAILFDIPEWRKRSENMVTSIGTAATRYPASFGVWANLLMEMICGTREIVVIGGRYSSLAKQILAEYIPHKVFVSSATAIENLPLLAGKSATNEALIYLCKDYSCSIPVSTTEELLGLIAKRIKVDS